MYYVYVLKSLKNNRRYIGHTSKSPQIRLKEHNAGSNQYTNGNRPFELIHFEECDSEDSAMKREKFLKSGTGRRVLNRILDDNIRACNSAG